MCCKLKALLGTVALGGLLAVALTVAAQEKKDGGTKKGDKGDKVAVEEGIADAEFALPKIAWKQAFRDEQPIQFVNQNMPEWGKLDKFWTEAAETVPDPATGLPVT